MQALGRLAASAIRLWASTRKVRIICAGPIRQPKRTEMKIPPKSGPSAAYRSVAALPEPDAAPLPHLRLGPMLGLQLSQELIRRERLAEDLDLLAHGREVAMREAVQRGQP